MSNEVTEPPLGAHPKIRAIFEYWKKASPSADVLPGRKHIDPVDIPNLLANVWLLDVVGRPERFRIRLMGSVLKTMGMPGKPGDFLDQFHFHGGVSKGLEDFRVTVARRQPVWFRGDAMLAYHSQIFELERIYLPLATDGVSVDMLLCFTVFYMRTGQEI